MEGGLISVAETLVLPNQPTDGTLRYVPLGGDGFVSPFAAQALRGFELTGDASSGNIEFNVTLDPRFVNLVSLLTISIKQATSADAEFAMDLASDEVVALRSGLIVAVSSLVTLSEVRFTWVPPATLLPGGDKNSRLRCQVLNVNGDVASFDLWTYLFNIRVRETTPIAPLLWAQGSSTN